MKRTARAFALGGCLLTCALPAAAQTEPGAFVEVKGGKLWYEACGSGPRTMVLLHDGLLHSAAWDDVWPELCKTFRVVRYDRRGYGRSPEAKAPYSPVEDVAAVMRATGMEHAVIIGASSGGGLAIDFTLSHPKQVDKLVVVGPDVTGLGYSTYFTERLAEEQGKMARGDLLGALKSSWVMARGDDANLERLQKLLMASPQDIAHQDPATPSPPAAPRLGQIKIPTLVLVGEDDVADNHAKAGAVEYAIPGARRVVIRTAGHMLYMEQPAEFTRIVSRFIDPPPAVASPGTEQALRRAIEEMRRGETDYSRVSPVLADIMRKQVDDAKRLLAGLGQIKSMTFSATGPNGADTFVVVFDKGATEWLIKLGEGERIDWLQLTARR
ncbi:MAG: alpha/beta fold hydrolase [Caulobacteraceae bacterium]